MSLVEEANLRLQQLNDRSLSFSERCIMATSFLNGSSDDASSRVFFPKRHQHIFDWVTSNLVKLARSDEPRPEVFLSSQVWILLKVFSDILSSKEQLLEDSRFDGDDGTVSDKKRSYALVTDSDDFYDYSKSFNSREIIIKAPLLAIFQTTLKLVVKNDAVMEVETICGVITAYLGQERASIPVSFPQVTEFVKALIGTKSHVPPQSYQSILKVSLSILTKVVVGGAVNYKKNYGQLIKFCVECANAADKEENEEWLEFSRQVLFPAEYHDELLAFLVSESFVSLLNNPSLECREGHFHKASTFQKTLFIELSGAASASSVAGPREHTHHCLALIYSAFLKAVDQRITRQSGFNFFAFVVKRSLPLKGDNSEILAQLIEILQSRGNTIYLQRNDEVYREQSAVIGEIFESAMKQTPLPFSLLSSLARLNYYLVMDKLPEILKKLDKQENKAAVEFIIDMMQLSVEANQFQIFLESILSFNANSPTTSVNIGNERLQAALRAIFQKLPLQSIYQIYSKISTEIIKSKASNESSLHVMATILPSLVKLIDGVESFDQSSQLESLQDCLLESGTSGALNLLAELVKHLPEKRLVSSRVISRAPKLPASYLVYSLKCVVPESIDCSETISKSSDMEMTLRYLPVLIDDMSKKDVRRLCRWLLADGRDLCLAILKMRNFYEIEALRSPFLKELVSLSASKESKEFCGKVILEIPWEYFDDEAISELVANFWSCSSAVVIHLLQVESGNVRKSLIANHLVAQKDSLKALIKFLFSQLESQNSEFISRFVEQEHSVEFMSGVMKKLKSSDGEAHVKLRHLAVFLKYARFENAELVDFIKQDLDLKNLIKTAACRSLDDFDVIFSWLSLNSDGCSVIKKCLSKLPAEQQEASATAADFKIRALALKIKFSSEITVEMIMKALKLFDESEVQCLAVIGETFKRDVLNCIKSLSERDAKKFSVILDALLKTDKTWRFILGLQALSQLIHNPAHLSTVYSYIAANLERLAEETLKCAGKDGGELAIKLFLGVLKSFVQVKKVEAWTTHLIIRTLSVLRSLALKDSSPSSLTRSEVFGVLRLVINQHWRVIKVTLTSLVIGVICECMEVTNNRPAASQEDCSALSRIISELSSLRRGDVDPFHLLPLLSTFIQLNFAAGRAQLRKSLQNALFALMYHLQEHPQMVQLLSTALVVEHEHRVVLKSFLEEYQKFHRYSGKI